MLHGEFGVTYMYVVIRHKRFEVDTQTWVWTTTLKLRCAEVALVRAIRFLSFLFRERTEGARRKMEPDKATSRDNLGADLCRLKSGYLFNYLF